MAFEIPTDLIRQVQISLRAEAGLSSFDPGDPTLPALPSLVSSIAGFDPSPPYLRCKHCKGRLLRGIQSIICIYCGKQQQKEVPPGPISFKSTSGYRWLLESLDLDGSEIVGPAIEASKSNRVQSTSKDEISLSDLLDLKISWSDELEKSWASVANKIPEQSKGSLNLSGVDLDNFFPESRKDSIFAASEEEKVINKLVNSTERRDISSRASLSLFQNVQPSEAVVRSSEDKNAGVFSGWEADFQSPDTGNQHEGSISFDPFIGSKTDFSSHTDSVFGPGTDTKDREVKGDSAPFSASNDWIHDEADFQSANTGKQHEGSKSFDPFLGPTSDLSSHMDSVFGPGTDPKDREVKDDLALPAASNDWIQDEADFQTSDLGNQHEGSKSFDPFIGSMTDFSTHMDTVFGPGMDTKDKVTGDLAPPSASNGLMQDDLWNNMNSVTKSEQLDSTDKPKGESSTPSLANEWFQHDLWNNIHDVRSVVPQQVQLLDATIKAKDSLAPDDLKNPSSMNVDWLHNAQWQTNITSSSENDDSFDEWNDFTSSNTAQHLSKNNRTQSNNDPIAAVKEQSSEIDLLSTKNNFQDIDFGTLLQPNLFSSSISSQNGSAEFNNILPEVRTSDSNVGESAGLAMKNGDVISTMKPKDDAEMLMSQMHDLSFMLESDLSVPPKPDGHHSLDY